MRTIRNQNSAASCTAFGLCSMVNPGTAKAMRSATHLLGLAIWASHSTSGEFGKALARARDDHGARVDRSRRRLRGSPICAPSQTLAYPFARNMLMFSTHDLMSRGRGVKKLVIGCLLAFALAGTSVEAANWPQKQVRIFVPYAAGSVPDIIARLIFDRVQKNTGQTMVIINKPGAAGMIGADTVAKSESDGHTLLLAPTGPLATNALLYKK